VTEYRERRNEWLDLVETVECNIANFLKILIKKGHNYYYTSGSVATGSASLAGKVSVRRRETQTTDAGTSVISSDLKHRSNDVRDGWCSYSNRRDQSFLKGCCTAMWKANGKTTTLSLFLVILFPETETPCMRDALRQERILSVEGGSSRSH
jgi:hypothetical protein